MRERERERKREREEEKWSDKKKYFFIGIFGGVLNWIKISSNIKVPNFLDVALNLSDNSNWPFFLKMDEYPSSINVNSNHQNSIIKQVPKAVNMRISRLSSNKKSFHENSKMYIKALKNIGFKEEFTYLEPKMPNNINNNNNKLDINK